MKERWNADANLKHKAISKKHVLLFPGPSYAQYCSLWIDILSIETV